MGKTKERMPRGSGGNLKIRYEGKAHKKSRPGLEESLETSLEINRISRRPPPNQDQQVEALRTADEGVTPTGTHGRYGTHTTWGESNPLPNCGWGVG